MLGKGDTNFWQEEWFLASFVTAMCLLADLTIILFGCQECFMDVLFNGRFENGVPVWSNQKLLDELARKWDKKTFWAKFGRMTGQRSAPQNAALHLYFEHLAKELNDGGYSVQLVLKQVVDLEWDGTKVKELIWRPLQKALIGKVSTTELDKVSDINEVFEHLNRYVGEKFGIHVPFPSEHTKP
jgi:hypothetical protein